MTTETPAAPAATTIVDPKAGLEQNDRKYPRLGSTIRAIWDWCDSFVEARNAPPARAELLEVLQPAGYHPATLATQYAAWRRFHGITGTVIDPAKAGKKAEAEAEKAAKAGKKAEEKAAKEAAKLEAKAAKDAEKVAKAEAKAAEKAVAAAAKEAAAQAAAAEQAPEAPTE